MQIIRDGTKKEFDEIVERFEDAQKQRVSSKKKNSVPKHIKKEITGQRPKTDFGEEMACVCACSAEGHVEVMYCHRE